MIAVYIPCKDDDEAGRVGAHLLEKKLVACANIWPIRSMYMWKGNLVDEGEVVCLLKSTEDKYEAIKQEVAKVHSYEVPAIIKFNISANEDYEKWLRDELNQQKK
mgnify:CR=1 FL=1